MTAGIFANRFISTNSLFELGFYYSTKGTAFQEPFSGKLTMSYLEIPFSFYYYPNHNQSFSYRFGLIYSILLGCCECLNGMCKTDIPMYRNYDTSASLGIRFKNEKSRVFVNHPILNKLQFLLKFDCSILPITIPEKVQEYNVQYSAILHHKLRQRNMALTFSVQYYFGEFSR